MESFIAVAVFTLLVSRGEAADFTTCQKPTPAPNAVKMPPLPDQFSTVIEANFLDQKVTMDITEYYDYPGNRGALIVTQQGMTARVLYNYGTNELITMVNIPGNDGTIVQTSCDIQPLNATDNELVKAFSYTTGNKTNHIYSVSHVFDFGGPPESRVYMNRTHVRGITVDHWYSCGLWSDGRSLVETHWYYSADGGDNWHSPMLSSVPVRAHIRGNITDEEGKSRMIEHIYDFVQFRFELPEGDEGISIFQVPPKTYCEAKVSTKPFPNLMMLPLYFTVGLEFINPVHKTISHAAVTYDQMYNMARYETTFADLDTNPQAAGSYGAMVMIHDFNSGVQYRIESSTGSCTIQAIDPTLGDSKPTADQIQLIRIASVTELLRLNQTAYSYQGTRPCRMAQCDVYVMLRDDWPYDNTDKIQTIWEWYFLRSDWSQLGAVIPFKVVITQLNRYAGPLDAKYNLIVNFFDWDAEDEPNIFTAYSDVSYCYTTSDQRKHLRFELPAQDDRGRSVQLDIKSLRFNIMDTIIGLAELSPLRIYDLQIEYELGTENILVTFTLLEAPPSVGGVVNPIPELTLEEATKSINNSINTGRFSVPVSDDPEDQTFLVAKPVSLIEVVRIKVPCPNKTEIIVPVTIAPTLPPTTTTNSPTPTDCVVAAPAADLQLSSGVLAGIAVGSALGGALIAVLIGFLVQWRLRNYSGSSNFPMMRFK